jgi:hypothetical protein
MTAIKDFDLQEERDKLQSQLSLLGDILRKKAEFEAEHKKFLDIKVDVQQLSTKLATLEEDLAVQQAEIERDTKDHEVKKQQWKEKSDKFECILFNDDVSLNASEPDSYDLDQLKIAAELAKENSDLFAQLLHIRELKKGLPSWQSAIDETKLSLSTKEKLREDLETLCPLLKSVFEKSEAEFHLNNEPEQLQKQIKTMVTRNSQLESTISGLQRSTEAKDKTISNQKSRILNLESDLRTKDQLVDSLQTKFSFLSADDEPQIATVVNATNMTTEEKVNMAFMKGRYLIFRRLSPLALAGRHIRGRKLEWQKSSKDKSLLQKGNMSSHYGMALADASLFQKFCPSTRIDSNTYMDLYVLHPNFVWKYQDCMKLLQILDWHGAMKDFHAHSYAGISFEKTKFYQSSRSLLSSMHDHENIWDHAKLNECFSKDGLGYSLYEILEKEHDIALKKHQDYLERRSA